MATYEDLVKCGYLEMKLPRKQRKMTQKVCVFNGRLSREGLGLSCFNPRHSFFNLFSTRRLMKEKQQLTGYKLQLVSLIWRNYLLLNLDIGISI